MGAAHSAALVARGLDPEQAAKRGWHACAGPSEGLWIGIPYLDEGARVACKRRTIGSAEKKFTMDRGGRAVLWNVDCLRDETLAGEPLIITEGEVDAEAAIEAGFPRTVSVPGGAPQHPLKDDAELRYLTQAAELLAGVRPIILAVDADGPGKNLLAALAGRLGRHRCKSVVYPAGKDLGDVLAALGQGGVRDVITQARWMRSPGLYRAGELPEAKRPMPLNIGMVGMDEHYRMRRGDLAVVTGQPGHGKSSFLNNLCCNMAVSYGMHTCWASFEQHPTLDHRRALRSYFARKFEHEMSDTEKEHADRWIGEKFSFVWPSHDDAPTLSWVMERFAEACTQFGAGICVIDPWNALDHSDRPEKWTETEYIHHALRLVRKFGIEYDVCMVVAAHPKMMLRAKDGKIPAPGLYDISGSAAWANRCDVGLVIHRPDMLTDPQSTIAVVKSRYFSQIGRPGLVKGIWHENESRYTIVDDGAGMAAR